MLAGIRDILIISLPQDLPHFDRLLGTAASTAALEEIAFYKGWISRDTLYEAAQHYGKSTYGVHLKKVVNGKIID